MRFEKTSTLVHGCEKELTDFDLAKMIVESLVKTDCLPHKFLPGSCIKVTVNLDFSIPDYKPLG